MNSKMKKLSKEEVERILDKDIIELIGLKDITSEKKQELLENMMNTIENRVFARVVETLKKEGKLEEYDKAEDLDKFLEEEGIDIDKMFIEESTFYKFQLAGFAEAFDDTIKPAKSEKKKDKEEDK